MRVLAASACNRIRPRPELVRFHQVTWTKELGSFDKRLNEKREQLVEHRCGVSVKLPGGRGI